MNQEMQPRGVRGRQQCDGVACGGWWRDRGGAARRIVAEVALLARGRGGVWTIVFDGPGPRDTAPSRSCLTVIRDSPDEPSGEVAAAPDTLHRRCEGLDRHRADRPHPRHAHQVPPTWHNAMPSGGVTPSLTVRCFKFPVPRISVPVRVLNFPVMFCREFTGKTACFQWVTAGHRPEFAHFRENSLFFPCLTGKSEETSSLQTASTANPPLADEMIIFCEFTLDVTLRPRSPGRR